MKPSLLCIAFVLCHVFVVAQGSFTPVRGLPTQEIYDLLADRKGFLWIGHDLGLSRFDGNTFTHFSNEEKLSVSLTDLIADRRDRVWCHNFSGQIFYAQGEKLRLLRSYVAAKEAKFPRMVILGDELVATSSSGLFICDLRTLRSRYLAIPGVNCSTSSITVSGNRVIAFGKGNWYAYQPATGMTRLIGPSQPVFADDACYLHPVTYRDTLLVTHAPSAQLFRLTISGNAISLKRTSQTTNFVNTVSLFRNELWLNTRSDSYIAGTNRRIAGLSLTDIVSDWQGNTWLASLKYGLLANYRLDSDTAIFRVAGNDYVRSLSQIAGVIAAGTQNGTLLVYDPATRKVNHAANLPASSGSIEHIFAIGPHNVLVAASTGTWTFDLRNRQLKQLDKLITKSVDLQGDFFIRATADGLTLHSAITGEPIRQVADLRCRAVCFGPGGRTIYAIFNGGLSAINGNKQEFVTYEGKILHPASVLRIGTTIFAGDYNLGLFTIHGKQVRRLAVSDSLFSKTITNMKAVGDLIWLWGASGPQLYDPVHQKLLKGWQRHQKSELVLDATGTGNTIFLAALDGVFSVSNRQKPAAPLRQYLQYALVNHHDTIGSDHARLNHDQNAIQFRLAAPSFTPGREVTFKYRLLGGRDSAWLATGPGERTISYSALMPGRYRFEAIAISGGDENTRGPLVFNFAIRHPWWQEPGFQLGLILVAVVVVALAVGIYYHIRLRRAHILYEQQVAIAGERQRISDELHDNISAGLTAVRLSATLAENRAAHGPLKNDIGVIASRLSVLTKEMREVIWTLNPENDTIEGTILYIRQQAVELLSQTSLVLTVTLPAHIPAGTINGRLRRACYLSVKEALQNVLKHSGATKADLRIAVESGILEFKLSDNGMQAPAGGGVEGTGIRNIRRRSSEAGGSADFSFGNGTTLTIRIPVAQGNRP